MQNRASLKTGTYVSVFLPFIYTFFIELSPRIDKIDSMRIKQYTYIGNAVDLANKYVKGNSYEQDF